MNQTLDIYVTELDRQLLIDPEENPRHLAFQFSLSTLAGINAVSSEGFPLKTTCSLFPDTLRPKYFRTDGNSLSANTPLLKEVELDPDSVNQALEELGMALTIIGGHLPKTR